MDQDHESLLKEFIRLKEENKFLLEENTSLNNDRELAGELGKTLLEQNKELESKLEEMNMEYASVIIKMEEIKQINHTFRSRLETEFRTKEHHIFEIENIKERLQKQFDEDNKLKQITNNKKVNELRNEIDSLQLDFNKHLMLETQLKEKIEQQERMLENVRKYNKQLQFAANFETDLEEQRSLCSDLQIERDALLMTISDLKSIQEQLKFDNKAILEKHESVTEDLQEKNRQSQTWYSCLQEARQEAGELKVELESLKADVANKNFKKKGNSLFGEVEDRRLELESKYLCMQAQHECLLRTHNVTKQHLHKLKNQVAALLQVRGNTADVSQLQRLQKALGRKEGEVKILTMKLNSLEKKQAENSLLYRLKQFHNAFTDFGDKKDYVNFLEQQLEEAKKKTAAVQKELQTKTLVQLGESERLRHSESQLYNAESNLEKLRTENMRLKLRVEDLRMKLQKETKTKTDGGAVKNDKTSKQAVKQLPKIKSVSALKVKNTCTCIKTQNTMVFPSTSVKQVQKVTPKANVNTSPENIPENRMDISKPSESSSSDRQKTSVITCISTSVFDEIAAVDQGTSLLQVDTLGLPRDLQADNHVILQDVAVDESKESQAEANCKENTSPKKRTVEFKTSEDINATHKNNVLGVRGQKQTPAVINVGKGANMNECVQQ